MQYAFFDFPRRRLFGLFADIVPSPHDPTLWRPVCRAVGRENSGTGFDSFASMPNAVTEIEFSTSSQQSEKRMEPAR